MSNTIDTRVVEMKFDNAAFERNIATTLKSLGLLESKMQLKGAANGLNEVQKAAGRFSLGNIAQNVEQISSKFSAMGVIGVTALASITQRALAAGAAFAKSFTIEPLRAGLAEYETNLNSIQTILANTGLEGKKGLLQVTGALDELNHYADQTIYNFSEMAKNIGTFTAAGVKLGPATAAIKGIANLAAVSGSNAEQASSAMYQLSQAMAAGKATLVDWNSVVNAGMGGKVFQESLKETARVQGVNIDAIIKKNGSFRDSLQEGWLTTKVLTETLSKFTGDLTRDQLKAMGYNEKQIAGIIKMGQTAKDAATKVKTMSQLIGTLQEAASSGWAKTWQLVFGDFDEARELFTNVNNVLGGFISASSDARNKVVQDWKTLGGRAAVIEGISNIFNGLLSVLKPVKDAFREIFPPVTGARLAELSKSFLAFTKHLKVGSDTANNIKRTFAGVFAIFSIGISVLKGIGTIISTVFKELSGGSGGLLEFTGSIGDWLVALDKAIKKGEGFKEFFQTIGHAISVPLKFLQQFIGLLGNATEVLGEFVSGGASELSASFNPLQTLGKKISAAWDGVLGILKGVAKFFAPLAEAFRSFFAGFGDAIAQGTEGVNWDSILASINTGLFAGLVLIFRNFMKNGFDFTGGFMDGIKEALGGLTGTLGAMQQNLKANALMKLAVAIGLLAVSVKLLSTIDPKQLALATGALAAMFGQLVGAMKLLEIVTSATGFVKMPVIAASLILLSVAINLLAVAVKNLSSLSWEELAKGLSGVAVLLGSLALFTKFAQVGKGSLTASASLILLAVAIGMLVDSVSTMSGMNWEEIAKGLVGVGALLASLALFTKLAAANKGGLAQGAGLLLVALGIKVMADAISQIGNLSWEEIGKGLAAIAIGLGLIGTALALIPATSLLSAASIVLVALSFTKIALAVVIVVKALDQLADVVKKMSAMSWGEIARGLTVMAASIVLIGAALYLLPKTAIFSAGAIYIVAQALVVIAKAMGTMGGMSWGEIAKSLVVLAGSLGIIAAALYLMTAAIPGALALVVVAASLRLLAPALIAFGDMSWGEILKGLVMLSGVFLVLGVAGALLTPVVPTLLLLAAAIALLGLGSLAAGAGMLLFATGLAALSVSGAAAAGALVGALKIILGAMPALAGMFATGLIAFAKAIETATPAIMTAMVKFMLAVLKAIDTVGPKILQTLGKLALNLLTTLQKYLPQMVNVGMNLIVSLLNGIARKIGSVVTAATNLIIAFLNGVKANFGRLAQTGAEMIVSFINSVASAIRNNSAALGQAGANLASAIIEGMARGLAAGVGTIASKAKEVASSALSAAKGVLGIHSPSKEFEKIGKYVVQGFVKGMDGNKADITNAFNTLRTQLLDFQKEQLRDIDSLEKKLKKLKSARKQDKDAIIETTRALALARAEFKKANSAYNLMNKSFADDQRLIQSLADKYDVLSEKIKKAQENAANLTKIRDDYARSLTDQYGDLKTPEDDQSLADYIAQGKKQVQDSKVLDALLQRLRKLGLNDESYKDFLAKGIASIPFLSQLLASGKSGVNEINKIGKDLDAIGSSIGKKAATNLYQAGVEAARGIVRGLQAQQSLIEKQMDGIALAMLKAIKKALGIKSPSREMMKVAQYTVQGMSMGLDRYSGLVSGSATRVGDEAINALRKSMSGISDVVTTDADFNPIIRPVLDLTDVRTDAGQISNLLSSKPLQVDAAYEKARNAASGYRANQTAQQDVDEQRAAADISFTQINNSPKALSNAEIYRQTKNQLSVAKGALDKP